MARPSKANSTKAKRPASAAIAAPYGERIARVRPHLAAQELDALVVSLGPSVVYLSGFVSSNATVILDAKGAAHLVTDTRYIEAAQKQLPGWAIHCTPQAVGDDWWIEFYAARGYKTIGFEGGISYDAHAALKRQVKRAKLLEAGSILRELRIAKDTSELAATRAAARLADKVLAHTLDFVRVGHSEREISAFIRRIGEELGADSESFSNIVAGGPNSSLPHHHPGTRKLRKGDALILDLGVKVRGYCSDMTRTVVLGKPSREFVNAYGATLQAQLAALDAVRVGTVCSAVDAVAREKLKAHDGLDAFFTHGLGHGVGLEIHEAPRLNSKSKVVLAPGMVVTVEPGVYMPGKFGIRIEDLVIVRESGPEVLCSSTKELLSL